jgi:hypothetical protein
MSDNYESILEAARKLPPEQQLLLAEQLTAALNGADWRTPVKRGIASRHFGAWDSGDERSADNERIDLDLASEYGNSR